MSLRQGVMTVSTVPPQYRTDCNTDGSMSKSHPSNAHIRLTLLRHSQLGGYQVQDSFHRLESGCKPLLKKFPPLNEVSSFSLPGGINCILPSDTASNSSQAKKWQTDRFPGSPIQHTNGWCPSHTVTVLVVISYCLLHRYLSSHLSYPLHCHWHPLFEHHNSDFLQNLIFLPSHQWSQLSYDLNPMPSHRHTTKWVNPNMEASGTQLSFSKTSHVGPPSQLLATYAAPAFHDIFVNSRGHLSDPTCGEYILNDNKDLGKYHLYAMSSQIMAWYSYPASLMNQNEIILSYHVNELIWHWLCP